MSCFLGASPRFPCLATATLGGATAAVAQVVLVRELMVAVFGNEITIAITFAAWLVGIGSGAALARGLLTRRLTEAPLARTAGRWLPAAGALLPLQVTLARSARSWLQVPGGEYLSFAQVSLVAALVCLPGTLLLGMVFPAVCHALARDVRSGHAAAAPQAASAAYIAEALGSMALGLLLTYVLLSRLDALRLTFVGMGTAFAGGFASRLILAPSPLPPAFRIRQYPGATFGWAWAAALAFGLAVAPCGATDRLAWQLETLRWRAFRVLHAGPDADGARLVATADTPYQNLALVEWADQFTLYADGQVLWVFPDPVSREHDIHFLMAQNPGAERVLLLGGNVLDDARELLKYPLRRLAFVQVDPGIGRLMEAACPGEMQRLAADPRLNIIAEDGVHFVRRCPEAFDLIVVNAAEPATAGASRYYTVEFYSHLRRILRPGGMVCTAVSSSERLQSEAADVAASVFKALRRVFPCVLVTAEARNRFLAGDDTAPLTFDRAILEDRIRRAAIPARYFRPEYFRGADEIAPEKTDRLIRQLADRPAEANTVLSPTTYYYQILLWNRFSESALGNILARVRRLSPAPIVAWVLALAASPLALAGLLRATGRRAGRAARTRVASALIGLWLLATGWAGMAMEIVLVYLFQSVYGHVYSRVGMIAAMFMLGLAAGGRFGGLAARQARTCAIAAFAADASLVMLALTLPWMGRLAVTVAEPGMSLAQIELLTYAIAVLLGGAVGVEFPCAVRFFAEAGASPVSAAGWGSVADHLGAAAGSFLAGVVLIPALGVVGASLFLAAIKTASLLALAGSRVWSPPRG